MNTRWIFGLALALAAGCAERPRDPGLETIRVCAEPGNLPFSNDRRQGFENAVVEIVARELRAEVEWTFVPLQRGFARKTLKEGLCDVIAGVPSDYDPVLTTRPYYRSAWTFATRERDRLEVTSFDAPALRTHRVGVPLVGDDGANPPPVHVLTELGIVDNVVGFPALNGEHDVLAALERGDVDVAIVWGPVSGWWSKRARVPMRVSPMSGEAAGFPLSFDISMGVRKKDRALRDRLDGALVARREEIRDVLTRYGVPLEESREVSR